MKLENKQYCMNSYLMYRTICNRSMTFDSAIEPSLYEENSDRKLIYNSYELEDLLKKEVEKVVEKGDAALALSGGIDSAILAKFMPKGSVAYTFKCIVPGVEVIDETAKAAEYAKECGLEHRIIEIYWEDFEKIAPELMKHKGIPIHSIEVQIAKAALQAKKDGFTKMIFGESADANFGGLDGLLSKEWTIGQFIERYAYVLPYKVLRQTEIVTEPIERYAQDGMVDVFEFIRHVFYEESVGSYVNASKYAGVELVAPYTKGYMAGKLDYNRIRSGENKYWIREIFQRIYPGWDIPKKTPMPRPMNEWLEKWCGPTREEFWPKCVEGLNGDQKWLVWALERFLNMMDEGAWK